MLADVAIACAWEAGKVTDDRCCVTWHVANAVTVGGDYFDSIRIVWIGGFWYKAGNEFAKMFADTFAVGDACDIELHIVADVLFLWPDAYVVAFVFGAEVLEFLDGRIKITVANYYLYYRCVNRVVVVVKEIEVCRLLMWWRRRWNAVVLSARIVIVGYIYGNKNYHQCSQHNEE